MEGQMNTWSVQSQNRLATCHPDLQLLFNTVLQIFNCSVTCGHRGQAEQDIAFASGNSKKKWPDGEHNSLPSMAIDVRPIPTGFKLDDNNRNHIKYYYHFAGIVLGVADMLFQQGRMTHRVRFGGDWNTNDNFEDNSFNDLYHWELVK